MKRKAHKENPLCHWCGAATFLLQPNDPPHYQRSAFAATVDHVKCRMECKTKWEWNRPENKVLACYACNQRRNREYWIAHRGEVPVWKDGKKRRQLKNRQAKPQPRPPGYYDAIASPACGHTYY